MSSASEDGSDSGSPVSSEAPQVPFPATVVDELDWYEQRLGVENDVIARLSARLDDLRDEQSDTDENVPGAMDGARREFLEHLEVVAHCGREGLDHPVDEEPTEIPLAVFMDEWHAASNEVSPAARRSRKLLNGCNIRDGPFRLSWSDSNTPADPEEVICDIDSTFLTHTTLEESVGPNPYELQISPRALRFAIDADNHISVTVTVPIYEDVEQVPMDMRVGSMDMGVRLQNMDPADFVEKEMKLSQIPNAEFCHFNEIFRVHIFFPRLVRISRNRHVNHLTLAQWAKFWRAVGIPAIRVSQSLASLQRAVVDSLSLHAWARDEQGHLLHRTAQMEAHSAAQLSSAMQDRVVGTEFDGFFFHTLSKGIKHRTRAHILSHDGDGHFWYPANPAHILSTNYSVPEAGLDYIDVGLEIVPPPGMTYLWNTKLLQRLLRHLGCSANEDIFMLSGRYGGATGKPYRRSRHVDHLLYVNAYLVLKDVTYVHRSMNSFFQMTAQQLLQCNRGAFETVETRIKQLRAAAAKSMGVRLELRLRPSVAQAQLEEW
ncbi:hypothetical protein HK405_008084 [Cladochytrium tenue]|nr:hypothetical protein HK405_008084 [Cladochytrium tenue]